MRKIIHNIRRQPEEVRRHIVHVLTAVFAVILLSLWVYSLGANVNTPEKSAKTEKNLETFSALKANLVGGYKSITGPSLETE